MSAKKSVMAIVLLVIAAGIITWPRTTEPPATMVDDLPTVAPETAARKELGDRGHAEPEAPRRAARESAGEASDSEDAAETSLLPRSSESAPPSDPAETSSIEVAGTIVDVDHRRELRFHEVRQYRYADPNLEIPIFFRPRERDGAEAGAPGDAGTDLAGVRTIDVFIEHENGRPLFSAEPPENEPRSRARLVRGIHLFATHEPVPPLLPWSIAMLPESPGFGTYHPDEVGTSDALEPFLDRTRGVFESTAERPYFLHLAFRRELVASAVVEEETSSVVFRLPEAVTDSLDGKFEVPCIGEENFRIPGVTVELSTLDGVVQGTWSPPVTLSDFIVGGFLRGPYRFFASDASGRVFERFILLTGTIHFTAKLRPPATIEGTVLDGNGSPLSTGVRLLRDDGPFDLINHFPRDGIVVATDAGGSFHAEVPHGRYLVQLIGSHACGFTRANARGGDVLGLEVIAFPGTEVSLDLGLAMPAPCWWAVRDLEREVLVRGYATRRFVAVGRLPPGSYSLATSFLGVPGDEGQEFNVGATPVVVVREVETSAEPGPVGGGGPED